MTILYDYNLLSGGAESYDVQSMKKKFEGWKMKDFKKKWPGGEQVLYANVHSYITKFNIEEYYKLIKDPILNDLKAYISIP